MVEISWLLIRCCIYIYISLEREMVASFYGYGRKFDRKERETERLFLWITWKSRKKIYMCFVVGVELLMFPAGSAYFDTSCSLLI